MREHLRKLVTLAKGATDQSFGTPIADFSNELTEFILGEPFRVDWVTNVVPTETSVRLLGTFELLTAGEIEGLYDEAAYEFSRCLKPLELWVFGYSDGSVWAHDAVGDRVVYMAPLFDEQSFEDNILRQWSSVEEFVDYACTQATQ